LNLVLNNENSGVYKNNNSTKDYNDDATVYDANHSNVDTDHDSALKTTEDSTVHNSLHASRWSGEHANYDITICPTVYATNNSANYPTDLGGYDGSKMSGDWFWDNFVL
jgi:hypothetical protein